MLPVRMLGRALPKSSLRQPILRCMSSLTSFSVRRPTWQTTRTSSHQLAFSTSTMYREPAGTSDQELSAKLDAERALEMEDIDALPAHLQAYIDASPFTIEDKTGSQFVTLTREFGNEKIKIEVSVQDIAGMEEDDGEFDMDEDAALADEEDIAAKRTINQSGTRGGNVDVLPEDSIAPADRGDEDAAEAVLFPVRPTITITKGGKALQIQAEINDGVLDIHEINYYPNASALEPSKLKESEEATRLYGGPNYSSLDADLQAMFERYLEERGIDTEMHEFLPRYVDQKERKEYSQWLADVKSFVDE